MFERMLSVFSSGKLSSPLLWKGLGWTDKTQQGDCGMSRIFLRLNVGFEECRIARLSGNAENVGTDYPWYLQSFASS